ncbi:phage holin family protein [Nocardioides jishulii]|uniref:phage holin family protein n=1 Tax=Nocardioides jishulii TaxID=2575440 RepID=UPI0014853005|nr:phage holin family protein [Nocardioides jishulii]
MSSPATADPRRPAGLGRTAPGRLVVADLVRLLLAWGLTFVAWLLAAELLSDFTYTSWWPLFIASGVTGLLGMIVRPILVSLAAAIGWIAVALAALFGQALLMQLALVLVPGAAFSSFWWTVAAAWLTSALATLLLAVLTAGTDESFSASLLRLKPGSIDDPEVDGVVFVQLDGVSFEVMQWALQGGSMPTLRSWVDQSSHALHDWIVQMPCTTPASQQAILHGSADGVPAFRWYDRDLGRVLVANHPGDAVIIESRASTGHGLLADDGASISNLFTGDAPRASMTMSRVELTRGSRRTREVFARFMVHPAGLVRSMVRALVELVRERVQAARQRRLDVRPRVHRSWTFAALRAFSNGLLRDLNTTVASEEMMRGTRSIYIDYVDYDEVAHHAGATRIESLSTLTGLDQVMNILEKVGERAPRTYHFVVLSDHGQSQGEPFTSRYGLSLSDLCRSLTRSSITGHEGSIEGWGRVDSVLGDLEGGHTPVGMQRAASERVDRKLQASDSANDGELVVLASGNVGVVYVPGGERLLLEEVEQRWPDLVPGLVAHPGIGFVSALSSRGPVAIGEHGRRDLTTGVVEGIDPLRHLGDHAPAMLAAATRMSRAPELYVNSLYDPRTMDVAAFEPLVGCHGGLGGWQDRAFVFAPRQLFSPSETVMGGDELHRHLVAILTGLGHRTHLPPALTPP